MTEETTIKAVEAQLLALEKQMSEKKNNNKNEEKERDIISFDKKEKGGNIVSSSTIRRKHKALRRKLKRLQQEQKLRIVSSKEQHNMDSILIIFKNLISGREGRPTGSISANTLRKMQVNPTATFKALVKQLKKSGFLKGTQVKSDILQDKTKQGGVALRNERQKPNVLNKTRRPETQEHKDLKNYIRSRQAENKKAKLNELTNIQIENKIHEPLSPEETREVTNYIMHELERMQSSQNQLFIEGITNTSEGNTIKTSISYLPIVKEEDKSAEKNKSTSYLPEKPEENQVKI